MSKFNTIFEDHLKDTGLTRIRILFDPANEDSEHGDYVGYVLEEGEGGVLALVPDLQDTFNIRDDQYEVQSPCGHDSLASFKQHIVKFLLAKGYQDEVSDNMKQIMAAENPHELEQLVVSCGCNGMQGVLDLYRDFVTNAI